MNQSLDTENVTKLESLNLFKKKELITHYGPQDPEHSNRSSRKEGRKRKRKERTKPKVKPKKRVKQKNVELRPKKSVSKPLMDTLWAKFKSSCIPTARDCHLLSFQFSVTDKQISQWFCEKRKKYREELRKLKQNVRNRTKAIQTLCAKT